MPEYTSFCIFAIVANHNLNLDTTVLIPINVKGINFNSVLKNNLIINVQQGSITTRAIHGKKVYQVFKINMVQ